MAEAEVGLTKRRVIIESPYKGDIKLNTAYAQLACLDSIMRGEAPFASHLLYTQILDDNNADERALGIGLGFAWHKVADLAAFYVDLGMSPGMNQSMKSLASSRPRIPIVERRIKRDDLIKLLNLRP